jgi:hypothetical protein
MWGQGLDSPGTRYGPVGVGRGVTVQMVVHRWVPCTAEDVLTNWATISFYMARSVGLQILLDFKVKEHYTLLSLRICEMNTKEENIWIRYLTRRYEARWYSVPKPIFYALLLFKVIYNIWVYRARRQVQTSFTLSHPIKSRPVITEATHADIHRLVTHLRTAWMKS